MLDSIYHITLNYFEITFLGMKMLGFIIYMRPCYERHFITLPKSVNLLLFISFNAWRYFTSRHDVI